MIRILLYLEVVTFEESLAMKISWKVPDPNIWHLQIGWRTFVHEDLDIYIHIYIKTLDVICGTQLLL